MLLSIIIPVYNSASYIEKTLNSIINQGVPPNEYEIILINDGSKDNSLQLIREIKDKHKEIVIIDQENKGCAMARNKGLKIAKGKYIMFFDSDDIMEPFTLKEMLSQIEKEQTDLIIAGYSTCDENSQTIDNFTYSKDLTKKDLFYLYPSGENKLFKREILNKYNIFYNKFVNGEDLNLYLKYLIHVKTFSIYTKNNSRYILRQGSVSHKTDDTILDIIKVFDDVKGYYKKYYIEKEYDKIINNLRYIHYAIQFSKIRNMNKCEERDKLYKIFIKEIKNARKNVHVTNKTEFKHIFRQTLSILKTKTLILKK